MTSFKTLAASLLACAMMGSPAFADPDPAKVQNVHDTRDTLDACVLSKVVRLGKNNQESAETILKAVRAGCATEMKALEVAYYDLGLNPAKADNDRRRAEEEATLALLEARAK